MAGRSFPKNHSFFGSWNRLSKSVLRSSGCSLTVSFSVELRQNVATKQLPSFFRCTTLMQHRQEEPVRIENAADTSSITRARAALFSDTVCLVYEASS